MLWFTGYVNCSKHPIDTVTAISYNNNRKQITKKDRAWSVVRVQQAMLFEREVFIYHVQ